MTRASVRWTLLVTAVAMLGIALVGAFALSLVSTGLLEERHFVWLFWVNVAVAALLLLVLGLAATRLTQRLRRGKFGSKLLAKLAGIFVLVGVLPGLLIYGVSYQFVTRSVDDSRDQSLGQALDAGLALGRSTLEGSAEILETRARQAAQRLGGAQALPDIRQLEQIRLQLGAHDLVLLDGLGQVLASTGGSNSALQPERPAASLIRQARQDGHAHVLEGLDDETLRGGSIGSTAPPTTPAAPNARVRVLARLPDTLTPDPRTAATQQAAAEVAAAAPATPADSAPLPAGANPGGMPASTSAAALLASDDPRGGEFYLMAVQPLPAAQVAQALHVQTAYRDFQQRLLARDGLRRMYLGTLTLALVLSVFAAVLLAVMLGNQIVRPLLLLADGMRQVADGDLTAKPVFGSRDELGGLTRSFAQMTEQLAEARAQVQRGVAQLEAARGRLQTILDSLSAGVIVFDRDGHIDTVNPGATRILRQPLRAYRGRPLGEVPGLADFAATVQARAELHRDNPEAGERDHWQDAYELPLNPQTTLNLLLRGAVLAGGARLLVFDDISDVVSAQRSVAWAEVARRVAHEIKNPLTPIQLSAERLTHRLGAKLEDNDRAMLERSVGTIVTQVQAMKKLVDEFRDYARLPAARLAPLELNALVQEVLGLYGAAIEQGRLQVRLGGGLPWIEGDASQLRQVVHNLVQNGLDAVTERADGRVDLLTETLPGDDGQVRAVRLKVMDNGPGFSQAVLQRAFEPYVTTKTKGTGLGLAVVKKIADEHGARLRIANRQTEAGEDSGLPQVLGAQVSLSFSRLTVRPAVMTPPGAPPAA
ncbi:sensor histidine kinase [Pseudaquabacterium rugosum]|uniref:histidine kinase n=1 Tax=Pseudaquabacterium rugosum TaxID=2984194 RepID=A0ABU9BJ16_9BURK